MLLQSRRLTGKAALQDNLAAGLLNYGMLHIDLHMSLAENQTHAQVTLDIDEPTSSDSVLQYANPFLMSRVNQEHMRAAA